jgi:hypothetical protein
VFWTTLVFAVIERVPRLRTTSTPAWTLAEIPALPGRRARYGTMIAETVLLALFTTFVLLSSTVSTERDPLIYLAVTDRVINPAFASPEEHG